MSVNDRIAPGHSKVNVRVNVRHSLGLAKVNVHEWPQGLLLAKVNDVHGRIATGLAKVNDVNDRIAILLAKVNAETKTDLLNRLRT